MGKKLFLAVGLSSHIPQLYNKFIKKKGTRRESRFFSDKDKFWTKKTKALHLLSLIALKL